MLTSTRWRLRGIKRFKRWMDTVEVELNLDFVPFSFLGFLYYRVCYFTFPPLPLLVIITFLFAFFELGK